MSGPTEDDLVDLAYGIDARAVSFDIDEELYPRDSIYGAAYLFVDRCFVFLTRPSEGHVRVRLKARDAAVTQPALEALAGDFGNELLNQVMRQRIGESTAKIREYYMARAFFGTHSNATIDELLAELDREELEEAPLDIPVPWEHQGGSAGSTSAAAKEPAAESEAK